MQAGRLSEYKGYRELINAAVSLKDLNIQILIAGGPQSAAEATFLRDLERLCDETHIRSLVRFLGHVDDVDLLYAVADIFCQPNLKPEPYGLTFLEALHAGLPVITADHGGAREIFRDDQTGEQFGVLYAPGDNRALAVALRQLVLSPSLREAFALKGGNRARNLSDPTTRLEELSGCLDEAVSVARNGR